MKNVYQIGSGELTFDIIERIINENLKLELASEARERIQKCRDYLDKKIANSDTPLYGITTGFGSLCNRNISSDELSTLQENLVKSHACHRPRLEEKYPATNLGNGFEHDYDSSWSRDARRSSPRPFGNADIETGKL